MGYATELYRSLGRAGLHDVIHRFYDRLYADPWLGPFFRNVDQSLQERRLEDFMASMIDEEPAYDGSWPLVAHAHMYITQEMLDRRQAHLVEAIREAGHGDELVDTWVRFDNLWHGGIRKRSADDCKPALSGKPLLVVERPEGS